MRGGGAQSSPVGQLEMNDGSYYRNPAGGSVTHTAVLYHENRYHPMGTAGETWLV